MMQSEVDAPFVYDYSGTVLQSLAGAKRSGQAPGSKQKRVRKEQDLVETWLQYEEFKNWLETKATNDKKC